MATKASLLVLGVTYNIKDETDMDYSEYLGENYFLDFKISKSGRCSTFVMNHASTLDICILIAGLWGDVTFVAHDSLRKMPFAGFLCSCLQCIFVPRTGSDAAREQVVRIIENRQK